ncbi:hypothetical protein JT359_20370 [Candidatus Poribacteria bacterium]|nr:hypothetical protein [Candidatus Poribacteria bacterium]
MFKKTYNYFLVFCILLMITGCSTIFTAQEWSENYALMDGVQSTSPDMIDGNLETIGEAPLTSDEIVYSLNDNAEFVRNDSIALITLPEKKKIYRIILHSDNLRHFVIYVDKGKKSRGEDWHRVTEMEDVRSKLIDLKLKMPYYTHQIMIRILKTHSQVQESNTFSLDSLRGSGRLDRSILSNHGTYTHSPGRIREIELYGFKSVEQKNMKYIFR